MSDLGDARGQHRHPLARLEPRRQCAPHGVACVGAELGVGPPPRVGGAGDAGDARPRARSSGTPRPRREDRGHGRVERMRVSVGSWEPGALDEGDREAAGSEAGGSEAVEWEALRYSTERGVEVADPRPPGSGPGSRRAGRRLAGRAGPGRGWRCPGRGCGRGTRARGRRPIARPARGRRVAPPAAGPDTGTGSSSMTSITAESGSSPFGPEPVDERRRVAGPRHEVGEHEVLDGVERLAVGNRRVVAPGALGQLAAGSARPAPAGRVAPVRDHVGVVLGEEHGVEDVLLPHLALDVLAGDPRPA